MNYHQLLDILRDCRELIKCSNCNNNLEPCRIYAENFLKKNEEIYLQALCLKCGSEHKFKLLSRGVWGLIEVNNVGVYSINDYIEKLRSKYLKNIEGEIEQT